MMWKLDTMTLQLRKALATLNTEVKASRFWAPRLRDRWVRLLMFSNGSIGSAKLIVEPFHVHKLMFWESSASLTSPDAARIEIAFLIEGSGQIAPMVWHTRTSLSMQSWKVWCLPCASWALYSGSRRWALLVAGDCLLHHLSISDLFAAHLRRCCVAQPIVCTMLCWTESESQSDSPAHLSDL